MNAGDIPYFAYFIVSFALASALIGGVAWLISWVDRRKPKRHEWVAGRNRAITHRGFKSRMGAR
jgi:hypothetical protein